MSKERLISAMTIKGDEEQDAKEQEDSDERNGSCGVRYKLRKAGTLHVKRTFEELSKVLNDAIYGTGENREFVEVFLVKTDSMRFTM
ncbi:hypothetical protein DACRYDRAFT_109014 [Dacryopinax primogenitus]|uniref:Uncharacterized protein n=1 Tax=Dacryopinax primogenitus (strain DJM 731) TaxID=1858805 RepID=M5G337_DACPD|nr:uncharacterized protein DACRYDRAFT_109014 [Dacryopinax primogenitus]EJU00267.1 hypothetical protein DACRYDRAFT_109014 [Dacryopinax primogenitus]